MTSRLNIWLASASWGDLMAFVDATLLLFDGEDQIYCKVREALFKLYPFAVYIEVDGEHIPTGFDIWAFEPEGFRMIKRERTQNWRGLMNTTAQSYYDQSKRDGLLEYDDEGTPIITICKRRELYNSPYST